MNPLVADSKLINDCRVGVRQHDGVQAMLRHTLTDCRGRIGAHRDDLYVEFIELRPKLFPSL